MSKEEKKILVVDDDVDTCNLLSGFLRRHQYEVEQAHSGKSAMNLLREHSFDLVISDFRLGDLDGTEILSAIRELSPSTPVIIITGYSDIKTAVHVIKSGAFDYVAKPLVPDEILHTIKRVLSGSGAPVQQASAAPKAPKQGTSSIAHPQFLSGVSPEAAEIYKQIDLVAPTNLSIILYGESGSGKEAAARLIHNQSKRSAKPFVPVDCGAIPKDLAGSELFGYEKGAFTGATNAKNGHFEMAEGGTIFLDEVANLPYDVQAALLRAVQERKIRHIGGTKEIAVDVRIIVASNEDLKVACQKGKFREDLFHRFNEFSIHLPALRNRREDIRLFADYFLEEANAELGKNVGGFSDEVLNCFQSYDWPGNIREMKNVIKRAVLLTDSDRIGPQTLPLEISNPKKFMSSSSSGISIGDNHAPDLRSVAQEAEYETIMRVLQQVNFNKTRAAQMLNIDRKTLYNKMKAYNLLRNQDDSDE